MYVKLISELQIEIPPRNKDGILNYNSNLELMKKDGFKPLKESGIPEGMKYPEVRYSDNGNEIVQHWVNKPPRFSILQDQKKQEINCWRDNARREEGAEFNKDLFDIDETSQSNILAQIKVAELLEPTRAGATYLYRSKSNKDHELDLNGLSLLGLTIASKVNQIYSHSWDLKKKVDMAKNADDLDKIVW